MAHDVAIVGAGAAGISAARALAAGGRSVIEGFFGGAGAITRTGQMRAPR